MTNACQSHTLAEVQKLTKLRRSTLKRYIADGTLEAAEIRQGGRVRYRITQAALETFYRRLRPAVHQTRRKRAGPSGVKFY